MINSNRPAFYAVRVVLRTESGTETRDYVRGGWHISKDKFQSFALGDMIALCVKPGDMFAHEVFEVDSERSREAMEGEHLTIQQRFHA